MNLVPALALALLLASCEAPAGRCSTEPAGTTNAFFAGGDASREVVVTVKSMTPLADIGGFRYDMTDGSRLTWIAGEPIAALEPGRTARIVVDYSGGSPDASGILVFDGDRLLFAAITDQKPFQHALEQGIPGFVVASGKPVCRSRGRTKCHTELVNVPLTVEHAGERKELYHGERASLGEFEVRVLTAQQVTYSPRCADAGLAGVSLIIERR
jgi:hypothetical protein